VEDEIDVAFDRDRLHHVVVHEDELVGANVADVLQRRGLEVVHADDAMTLGEQVLTKMGAEKPGPPGDDRSGHLRRRIPGASGGLSDLYEGFTARKNRC
jgi:hypothetical protein